MCSEDRLIELATKFRKALSSCEMKKLFITLQRFPHGACGDASYLLAKYLDENRCGPFEYVLGERATDGHSHAWLEKQGLIIDITADQFEGQDQGVLVTADRSWHAQFKEEERDIADFEKYDDRTVMNLRNSYELVMERIDA